MTIEKQNISVYNEQVVKCKNIKKVNIFAFISVLV